MQHVLTVYSVSTREGRISKRCESSMIIWKKPRTLVRYIVKNSYQIVFNLTNGIDVERTQEKIRKYKQENQELIIINQSKRAESERELQARWLRRKHYLLSDCWLNNWNVKKKGGKKLKPNNLKKFNSSNSVKKLWKDWLLLVLKH